MGDLLPQENAAGKPPSRGAAPLLAPVPWRAVFGNDRPVEVEIGPGRGEALLAFAAAAPGSNFFAIEHAASSGAELLARIHVRRLGNVRVIVADARCVVALLVPDASVSAYHIYFPDPWPKTRHRRRRLASDGFARDLARTLVPEGVVHLASDLRPLVDGLAARLIDAGLRLVPGAISPPARPITAFERKYAREGTHYLRLARPAKSEEVGAPAPVSVDG